jgi:translation initiation factor 5
MSKINVNPEQKSDPNYRYKMSSVQLKFEGQGNGQRTVFQNINDIARELNRDPDIIISYLISVLGCKCIKNKEGHCVLYGTHTKDVLQDGIYDFISLFVLCQKCKNPETYYVAKEKSDVCMKCNACPEMSDIPINKITMKIIKQIGVKLAEAIKKEKEQKKKEEKLLEKLAKEEN